MIALDVTMVALGLGAQLLSLAFGVAATVLWFMAYRVEVPRIGPGQDELDKVALQSDALHAQAQWNNRAALCTAVALACQIIATWTELSLS